MERSKIFTLPRVNFVRCLTQFKTDLHRDLDLQGN